MDGQSGHPREFLVGVGEGKAILEHVQMSRNIGYIHGDNSNCSSEERLRLGH